MIRIKFKVLTFSFLALMLIQTLFWGTSEAAAVEIIKLQEDLKEYTTTYDQISLSTKTSGWTVCKEYAASIWIKKISWSSGYDLIFRLSNKASENFYNGRLVTISMLSYKNVPFHIGMTGSSTGPWSSWETSLTGSTILPVDKWVFIALSTSTISQKQTGFRYTLPSTSTRTTYLASRSPSGSFYDLEIGATAFIGDDPWYGPARAWLQYVRLYLNYYPNSMDEMLNLAVMDTGTLYIPQFSSTPAENNNQTIVVDYIEETTQGSMTAYKGISDSDTDFDPILEVNYTLSCRPDSILSFHVGGAAPNGAVFSMDIYPYSGGPETQTILSVRDSITNLISFVAEYSDSMDQLTFKRYDSGGSMDIVATPNLTLTKDAWNHLTIEYTQAQPLDLVGAHYSLRIFIGASNSTRVYFADSAGTTLAPVTALFFGVDDMILDFCSQLVGGTTPTDSGNFDIKNFMWFSGPAIVYTKTATNPNCLQTAFLHPDQNRCLLCASEDPNDCQSGCPNGYHYDIAGVCMDCTTPGYYLAGGVCIQCYTGCATCTGAGSDQCATCLQGSYYLQPPPNSTICNTSCPFGYEADNDSATCVQCSSTQVWYNQKCLEKCPEGFVKTDAGGCAKCSDSNLLYYNHTCVSGCPLKTFRGYNTYMNQDECISCYLGCDTCENETATACISCSKGFFYNDNFCNTGCPSDKYANPITRVCEQCQPPCVTCSKPNNHSCTSCPEGNFLLNGTCLTNCPADYYQSFLGDSEVFQVPTCLPKLTLKFDLSLTTQARVININFNYGIVNMIQAIAQKIHIQIANTQIDDVLFVLSPLTESKIQFEYIGGQYFPPLSLLSVTIDLDMTDFNNNLYQQFRIIEKTATIQLKEIYPFSNEEKQFISSTSSATGIGGSTIATIQTISSVSQGALSMSLLRLQIVGELIQIMRFIDIPWPPNVAEYYSTSHIDPTSMMLPIDFITEWNDQLADRNYSLPRIFEEYETPLFFSENYSNEFSNIILWFSVIISSALIFNSLKKRLRKMTSEMELPKTNARKKFRDHYIIFVHKLSRLLNRGDDSILWNFLLMFLLSCYQSGNLWALFHMHHASALDEPSTPATNGSLATGVIFLLLYFGLAGSLLKLVTSNLKYVLKTEEHLRPLHLRRYRCLFDDFRCGTRIQLLFVPISLLRSLLLVFIIALLTSSPVTQMILFFTTNLAFLLYLLIYKPLKEKWMRILTSIIEVLIHSCVTIGFIIGIVDPFTEIDATTRDEIGFVFLCLSLLSTLAGVLLCLIQFWEIGKNIHQYIKNRRAQKMQIYPIALTEIPSATNKTPCKEPGSLDDKIIDSNGGGAERRGFQITLRAKPEVEDRKMFEILGKLSPDIFEKKPEGKQLYGNLKEWFSSFSSTFTDETNDFTTEYKRDRKNSKNRTILFSVDET